MNFVLIAAHLSSCCWSRWLRMSTSTSCDTLSNCETRKINQTMLICPVQKATSQEVCSQCCAAALHASQEIFQGPTCARKVGHLRCVTIAEEVKCFSGHCHDAADPHPASVTAHQYVASVRCISTCTCTILVLTSRGDRRASACMGRRYFLHCYPCSQPPRNCPATAAEHSSRR